MDREITWEERRRQNIADNKRILAEIGLINPFKDSPRLVLKKSGLKRKAEYELPRQKKRPLFEENVDHSNRGSVRGTRRRSARLQDNAPGEGTEFLQLEDDFDEEEVENKRVEKNRPNHYGAIQGVDVGASWYTRMECCRDGIHRPTVAGIHAGAEGAFSIALSGGYDDNVDYGECFTYTGEGGRDLKGTRTNPKNLRTAPQSKNQTLTRGNLALSRNVETGHPVRVIRGYKLNTAFAPEEGYRYDGLYTVEKAWYTVGTSGFMVWKFALKRCKNQAPPPWEFTEEMKAENAEEKAKAIDQEGENRKTDQDINVEKDLDKVESKELKENDKVGDTSDDSFDGKTKNQNDESEGNDIFKIKEEPEKKEENTPVQENEETADQNATNQEEQFIDNESSQNEKENPKCSEDQRKEEEKVADQDIESEDNGNSIEENENITEENEKPKDSVTEEETAETAGKGSVDEDIVDSPKETEEKIEDSGKEDKTGIKKAPVDDTKGD